MSLLKDRPGKRQRHRGIAWMRRMRLIQATTDILIPVNGKRLPGLTHRHDFHPVNIHMVW
ncbi:hypothetical protein DFO55_1108 [Grimontella sp. AG753]|nr:hypothetical protein DFO55_1108 [Grimontella sp. AG753]